MNAIMIRSWLWRCVVMGALTLAAILFQLPVLPNDDFRLYHASGEETHFADPEIQIVFCLLRVRDLPKKT